MRTSSVFIGEIDRFPLKQCNEKLPYALRGYHLRVELLNQQSHAKTELHPTAGFSKLRQEGFPSSYSLLYKRRKFQRGDVHYDCVDQSDSNISGTPPSEGCNAAID